MFTAADRQAEMIKNKKFLPFEGHNIFNNLAIVKTSEFSKLLC